MIKLPKITCIIISKDSEEFIERCIQSILNQNYNLSEIVIVDGGSLDNTNNIIRKYKEHINVHISEKDKGPAHAMNKARRYITGDLVTFINSDDAKDMGVFDNISNSYIKTSGSYDVYSTGFEVCDHKGEFLYQVAQIKDLELDHVLFRQFGFNSMFIKKSFFLSSPLFYETFKDNKTFFACDKMWVAEIIIRGVSHKLVKGPNHIYFKHEYSSTFSGKNWIKTKNECMFIAEFLNKKYDLNQEHLRIVNQFYIHNLSLLIVVSFIKLKPKMALDNLMLGIRHKGLKFLIHFIHCIILEINYRKKLKNNYFK